MRTLQQLAQEAIDVQDACNLSGIVRSWGEAIADLRPYCRTIGTHGVNTHPINVLWAYKVLDLTSHTCPDQEPFSDAYQQCKAWAAGCTCPTGPEPETDMDGSTFHGEACDWCKEQYEKEQSAEVSDSDLASFNGGFGVQPDEEPEESPRLEPRIKPSQY